MDDILNEQQCVFCGEPGTMRSTNDTMCDECAAYWLPDGDESVTPRLERDVLRTKAVRVAEACAECQDGQAVREESLVRYVAELDAARAEVARLRALLKRVLLEAASGTLLGLRIRTVLEEVEK